MFLFSIFENKTLPINSLCTYISWFWWKWFQKYYHNNTKHLLVITIGQNNLWNGIFGSWWIRTGAWFIQWPALKAEIYRDTKAWMSYKTMIVALVITSLLFTENLF